MSDATVSTQALRAEREAAGVTVAALARTLRLSPTRLAAIEEQPTVYDGLARRYREALALTVIQARDRAAKAARLAARKPASTTPARVTESPNFLRLDEMCETCGEAIVTWQRVGRRRAYRLCAACASLVWDGSLRWRAAEP